MIDIHTHILPGVDDGARDEQMTAEMMARAQDAGVTGIICTPHVYRPEDQERNRGAVSQARAMARARGMAFGFGCELNYRSLLKTGTQQLEDFCMAGTRCILLEFSNDRLFPDWEFIVSEIVENGYFPIIAHPERYRYIQRDLEIAQTLCALGCELQVDAGGLMAGLFSAERKTARKLLAEGMVSYIASDAHRPEHYKTLEQARRTFKGEWPRNNQLLTFLRNPA